MNNLVTKASELIYQMDNDQLNQVIEAIKLKRTHLAKQAVRSFRIGDIVGFTGKRGNQVSGKVKKLTKIYFNRLWYPGSMESTRQPPH